MALSVRLPCTLRRLPSCYLQSTFILSAAPCRPYCNHSPNTTETRLTIYEHVKHLRSAPLPAVAYGLSGLIPFVGAPCFFLATQSFCSSVALAQTIYGASILSFLGGVRWGCTLASDSAHKPTWRNLGMSVAPSLVAWAGLLVPVPFSTCAVMAGLGTLMYLDMRSAAFPSWFKGLRFLLSIGAVLSLWTTLMCAFMLPKGTRKKGEEPSGPPKKP